MRRYTASWTYWQKIKAENNEKLIYWLFRRIAVKLGSKPITSDREPHMIWSFSFSDIGKNSTRKTMTFDSSKPVYCRKEDLEELQKLYEETHGKSPND